MQTNQLNQIKRLTRFDALMITILIPFPFIIFFGIIYGIAYALN